MAHNSPPQPVRKYPWDLWFNGDKWELVYGEDFETAPRIMTATAHTEARRRGGSAVVRTRNGIITMQFFTRDQRSIAS